MFGHLRRFPSLIGDGDSCGLAEENPDFFEWVEGFSRINPGRMNDRVDHSQISLSDLFTFLEYMYLRQYGGRERW